MSVKRNGKRRHLWPWQMREASIQRAVADLLRHSARPGVAWNHMPSGELRTPTTGAILTGMGHKPGWPDILLVRDGRLHGLELKRGDGRLSPAQVAAHQELAEAGATVVTAYGLDDAIRVLKGWGMVR